MAIVCGVCLHALTVFIIFSLASLVGVSVCYAQSYVVSSLYGGFPGLVGDSLSAFLHVSFDCFLLCAKFTYELTLTLYVKRRTFYPILIPCI